VPACREDVIVLAQFWNAALWSSSTILVVSTLVIAWARVRAGRRGAPVPPATIDDIENRDANQLGFQ
jgi:hypothetical protein